MARIKRFDHVGITVADLDTVMAFFLELGLEVEGKMFMEGEFVDTVIGIPNSRFRDRHAAAARRRNQAGAVELHPARSRTGIATLHVQ